MPASESPPQTPAPAPTLATTPTAAAVTPTAGDLQVPDASGGKAPRPPPQRPTSGGSGIEASAGRPISGGRRIKAITPEKNGSAEAPVTPAASGKLREVLQEVGPPEVPAAPVDALCASLLGALSSAAARGKASPAPLQPVPPPAPRPATTPQRPNMNGRTTPLEPSSPAPPPVSQPAAQASPAPASAPATPPPAPRSATTPQRPSLTGRASAQTSPAAREMATEHEAAQFAELRLQRDLLREQLRELEQELRNSSSDRGSP